MRQKIITVAEKLLRERGFHGWSYSDIANSVGIRKASIHYYFPKKEDLGSALILHYRENVEASVRDIDQEDIDFLRKLFALADLYGQSLKKGNAFCLCGMLTADLLTLPKKMREELKEFFKSQEEGIQKILEQGKGEKCRDSANESALIMSCLQGILLIARLKEHPFESYQKLAREFLKERYG